MSVADPVAPLGAGRPHPLAGATSVEESARLLRHYRFAVERAMRIMGGWIALTPELPAKLLFGRHVWDNAQHADLLGKRLPELRAPAQVSEPANARFVEFMLSVEEPSRPHETVERLVGIYRVLKPHLLAVYEEHRRSANAVYEPPTERILARMIGDERRHIAAGETILRHLVNGPGLAERAAAWQEHLEASLAAAGGVTGWGVPPPVRVDIDDVELQPSDDPREFLALGRPPGRLPIPEDLERALRAFGDAIVAGDVAGVLTWLPGGEEADAARLAGLGARAHEVVAFAKIGAQRVAKQRLDTPAGPVTLVSRWAPVGEGWRAQTLDVTGGADRTTPA